jgi:mannose-6-phosphate isomerase-like protein (cupin superfamily)
MVSERMVAIGRTAGPVSRQSGALLVPATAAALALSVQAAAAAPPAAPRSDSHVVNERDVAKPQPGPHEGLGTTTAYPFFEGARGLGLVFRKRALHPGATIGPHVNDKDEIYYVLAGRGELTMRGEVREVGPGDAILTRDGDSHALRQLGDEDLVIFIAYHRPPGN